MTLQTRYLVEGELPTDKQLLDTQLVGRNTMIGAAQQLGIERISVQKLLKYLGLAERAQDRDARHLRTRLLLRPGRLHRWGTSHWFSPPPSPLAVDRSQQQANEWTIERISRRLGFRAVLTPSTTMAASHWSTMLPPAFRKLKAGRSLIS